jgi:anti-sigma28 factor (negative regulator of flagellin synthesis)
MSDSQMPPKSRPTGKPRPQNQVSAARIAAIEVRLMDQQAQLDQMRADAKTAADAAKETHDMVRQIADALLKPQPGHSQNLLDRVAAVTIKAERGEWSIRLLLWIAAAASTLVAALASWAKWT